MDRRGPPSPCKQALREMSVLYIVNSNDYSLVPAFLISLSWLCIRRTRSAGPVLEGVNDGKIENYGLSRQRAKKVVSDGLGQVDFAIGVVISILILPDGRMKFFGRIQIAEEL